MTTTPQQNFLNALAYFEDLKERINDERNDQRESNDTFDMTTWGEVETCGTNACLGGWMVLSPELRAAGLRAWSEALSGDPEHLTDLEPVMEVEPGYRYGTDSRVSSLGGKLHYVGYHALMELLGVDWEQAERMFSPDHNSNLEEGIARMRAVYGEVYGGEA